MTFIVLEDNIWSFQINRPKFFATFRTFSAKLIIFYQKGFLKLSVGMTLLSVGNHSYKKRKKLKKTPFYILSKQLRENLGKSKARNVWIKFFFREK